MRAPGLRLHDRTRHVQRAEYDIRGKLLDLQEEHDLTDIEMLQVLNSAEGVVLKYMLRRERHPDDPEKKADEA